MTFWDGFCFMWGVLVAIGSAMVIITWVGSFLHGYKRSMEQKLKEKK